MLFFLTLFTRQLSFFVVHEQSSPVQFSWHLHRLSQPHIPWSDPKHRVRIEPRACFFFTRADKIVFPWTWKVITLAVITIDTLARLNRQQKSNSPPFLRFALTSIVAVSHLHRPQTHCPRPEQISDDPGLKKILSSMFAARCSLSLLALLNFRFNCRWCCIAFAFSSIKSFRTCANPALVSSVIGTSRTIDLAWHFGARTGAIGLNGDTHFIV